MENNESPLFMKIENNFPESRKKHTTPPVGADLEEDDDEDEILRLYEAKKKGDSNHKAHKKKILRRRSSLSAELEGGFESKDYDTIYISDQPEFLKTNHDQLLNTHQNVHSSMSLLSVATNNAITVAPSRNAKIELNVFDTRNHKRHRRRRAATPEPVSRSHHPANPEDNLQSVLSKLDRRIKNNFGDWSTMDDDSNFEYRNIGRHIQGGKNETRQGGANGRKVNSRAGETNGCETSNGLVSVPNDVSLPPLYKNYHAVLKSSKGKLTDKSLRIALSKDNNDPNSILSEAKRTLTQMGSSGQFSE